MLTSIVLPFFGLISIYHTFCTLLTYIPNKFLLFLCTVLILFLQIGFLNQILPHNSQFNTKYLLLQYIYPLWQTYYSILPLTRTMLPTPFLLSSHQRQKHSLTPDVMPFLRNNIFRDTNPLSFETEPHSIHTIPLARKHSDSY